MCVCVCVDSSALQPRTKVEKQQLTYKVTVTELQLSREERVVHSLTVCWEIPFTALLSDLEQQPQRGLHTQRQREEKEGNHSVPLS